jgi:hypothetical protein
MRIVFLGNFRVDYTSETHHANTLTDLGHDVVRMQETEATADDVLRESLEADLLVWVHTHGWYTQGSMSTTLKALKRIGIPSMTYHLDLWFGLRRQQDMQTDPYWDIEHFFTVDKLMADWLNENTEVKGHYLQAGVYDRECTISEPSKIPLDVTFVGSKRYHAEWQYRPQLVQWLQDTYGDKFWHFGNDGMKIVRGKELNQVYADSKVVIGDSLCINFNYPSYWSDRVYETLGRGGFMIHPYIQGMEQHFEDRKHLVFYDFGNWAQLKGLIDYYLTHEDEREAIRKAGHEHVKANHTYRNRWQTIIKEVCGNGA